MERKQLPFKNTLDGASPDDVLGLAEHVQKHFPGRRKDIALALRQLPHLRDETLRFAIRAAFADVIRERNRAAEDHVAPAAMTKEEATAKAQAIVKRLSSQVMQSYAAYKRLSPKEARQHLTQRLVRGLLGKK